MMNDESREAAPVHHSAFIILHFSDSSQRGELQSMSASPTNSGDIFDPRKIRRLVELMNEHKLSEIDLQQGDTRIRLRGAREPKAVTVETYRPAPVEAAPRAASETPAKASATPQAEGTFELIKSPMVGTFYVSPNPESPAFVKVGDHVGPESTVCIIEAMKVFNEISAEVTGKIVAVLVQNGEPVEYGQPLFKVEGAK
jgi:acetyl-CoA carboxylase biotin carboxyl carrier protein